MTAADEQHLLCEAKAGSHAAFRQLVEGYVRQTYDIAYSFAGDHDSAEDIVQEVLVKVHTSLGSFRGESQFGTWLYRIATNVSLNHVKRERRKRDRMAAGDPDDSGLTFADEDAAATEERRRHIERALHELPTMQRAVVILRHLDGLSTKQVSEILLCSEGTVKTHLFRGLARLRRSLSFLQESGS